MSASTYVTLALSSLFPLYITSHKPSPRCYITKLTIVFLLIFQTYNSAEIIHGKGLLLFSSAAVVAAAAAVHERAEEGVHAVDEVASAQRPRLHRLRLHRQHRLPRRQLRLQLQRQCLPHGPRWQDRPKHTQEEACIRQVGRVQMEWRREATRRWRRCWRGVVHGDAAVQQHPVPAEAPGVVDLRVPERRRRARHAVQDGRRLLLQQREAAGVLQDRRRRHRRRGRGGEGEDDGGRRGAGRRRADADGGAQRRPRAHHGDGARLRPHEPHHVNVM